MAYFEPINHFSICPTKKKINQLLTFFTTSVVLPENLIVSKINFDTTVISVFSINRTLQYGQGSNR